MIIVLVSPNVDADLVDRGGGLIYDTVLDVTWLGDANYAASDLSDSRVSEIISTVGSIDGHVLSHSDFLKNINTDEYSGQMTWWGAMAWAGYLVYEHPTLGVLYNDWRLPSIQEVDNSCTNLNGANRSDSLGFNCVGSELGDLFYNIFGGIASLSFSSLDNSINPELLKFSNIKRDFYHSGASIANCENLPSADCSAYFSMYSGFQWGTRKSNLNYAWAVQDGDIALHDYDNDTIVDFNDNCSLVVNPLQRDTDGDGYGNLCDPDFDNDLIVNAGDLGYLKSKLFTPDPLADLDGSGTVNAGDLAIMKSFFFTKPGPSGLNP